MYNKLVDIISKRPLIAATDSLVQQWLIIMAIEIMVLTQSTIKMAIDHCQQTNL